MYYKWIWIVGSRQMGDPYLFVSTINKRITLWLLLMQLLKLIYWLIGNLASLTKPSGNWRGREAFDIRHATRIALVMNVTTNRWGICHPSERQHAVVDQNMHLIALLCIMHLSCRMTCMILLQGSFSPYFRVSYHELVGPFIYLTEKFCFVYCPGATWLFCSVWYGKSSSVANIWCKHCFFFFLLHYSNPQGSLWFLYNPRKYCLTLGNIYIPRNRA